LFFFEKRCPQKNNKPIAIPVDEVPASEIKITHGKLKDPNLILFFLFFERL